MAFLKNLQVKDLIYDIAAKYDSNGNLIDTTYATTKDVEAVKNSIDNDVFVIVDSLPTENIKSKIYCVLDSTGGGTDNKYIEWVYTNGAWEKVGEFVAEPDLSDYATKTLVSSTKTELTNSINTVSTNLTSVSTKVDATINDDGSINIQGSINAPSNEFVDLGLPSGTLWMKCNIGAEKETDYGLFFQWGDTVGYDESTAAAHSTWPTCPGNGGNSSYNESALSTWDTANLTNNVLNTSVDAAYVHTNGKAKMPTLTQVQELVSGTNSEFTTIDGVYGRKFTNKSDSSKYIFIPAAGYFRDGSYIGKGSSGDVWSSSLGASGVKGAYLLYFSGGNVGTGNYNRCLAQSVRGVTSSDPSIKLTLPSSSGTLALTSDVEAETTRAKAKEEELSTAIEGKTIKAGNCITISDDNTIGLKDTVIPATILSSGCSFQSTNGSEVNVVYFVLGNGSSVTDPAILVLRQKNGNTIAGVNFSPDSGITVMNSSSETMLIKSNAFVTSKGTMQFTSSPLDSTKDVAKFSKDIVIATSDSDAFSVSDLLTKVTDNTNSIAEAACVYGVRHYYNNSSTALTRIGASNLHVTLPVLSLMRRCVIADDGSVVYYLDANDSTKKEDGTDAVLDGTDGQVMVEVPEHYRRHTLGSDYYDSEISLVPFTGAFKVNKYYVSMSEAAMDRTNNKLSSVVNTTAQYRGGNNTSSWDDTYRSLLGMPATSISTISFHTYANNRGTGWEMYEVDVHDDIYWLYVIEYANLNVLLAYNSKLTAEGYHQGGLGNGVIGKDWSTWNSYNSNNPIIPCGTTLSLGNNSGVVSYSPLDSDSSTAWGTFSVPSYRGIQNPYAHLWQWTIGYMGVGNGTNLVAYRCRNRKHYSTGSLNNYYSQVGLISSLGGWTKTIIKNKYGDFIPTSVGAGDTTYFSDYLWEAHNNGSIYAARVSGYLYDGSRCGLGCLGLVSGFGSAGSYDGSRLVYCASDSIIEA